MEIIQLSLPSGNFYNPGTGEIITGVIYDGNSAEIKSLKAVWNHEVIDCPDFFDEKLAEAWNTQYELFLVAEEDSPDVGYMYNDYEEMLEKFLTDYEHEDWAAFKVLNTQFGCGSTVDINWYVLDLGMEEEK